MLWHLYSVILNLRVFIYGFRSPHAEKWSKVIREKEKSVCGSNLFYETNKRSLPECPESLYKVM